jgi:hypothetical protein
MILPDAVHELIEWELAVAYAAVRDIAAARAELDATWHAIGQQTYEQRVAARVAEMKRNAIGEWPGLENGGVLPSANWRPATTALAESAARARAVAARYPPARCGRCQPPAGILCRCSGVITRRPASGQAAA